MVIPVSHSNKLNDRYPIYPHHSTDSCKLYTIYEVTVKVLATVAKRKPILLATWVLF